MSVEDVDSFIDNARPNHCFGHNDTPLSQRAPESMNPEDGNESRFIDSNPK